MTAAAAADASAPRTGRIRAAGAVALLALVALVVTEPAWNRWLPALGFDAFQIASPRPVKSLPATIVEIDERSLAALGRWPWPRSLLAQLVDDIGRQGPAAIGIDIFMPEPDPLSPDRIVGGNRDQVPLTPEQAAALPSNDKLLAHALAATPSVLAFAGMPDRTGMALRVVPFAIRQAASASSQDSAPPSVDRYAGAQTSIDALNRAASGWGLISAAPAGETIRRVPLAANVNGTLVPSFAIEVLRVAVGAPSLRLAMSGSGIDGIDVGRAFVPTDADGSVRIHFSGRRRDRFVSAVDVLEGTVDPARFAGRIVLVGVTGLGLGDFHRTPLGEAMPGTEIQAQLLENLLEGSALSRLAWASKLEAGVLIVFGSLLVWAVPAWNPRNAGLLALAQLVAIVAGAFAAFRYGRLVFDAATAGLALLVLFGVLLMLTLAEATRQRRALEHAMQLQRERAARMEGELDAARRIQTAFLPSAEPLRSDPRIDLAASMTPARETGGDLYDFFRVDPDQLFVLVGDVTGKGLSASIFMAVSRALYKSATLRSGCADLGALMAEANREISRDNPQLLFVTAFAGVLDLVTGALRYCNAGHENPYVVHANDTSVRRLGDGGGPPLCTVDDFAYRAATYRLRPGELLCMISDGVTDALDRAGERFGAERVSETLSRLRAANHSARNVVDALCAEVEAFASGTEAVDDITVLALRWHGTGLAPDTASAMVGAH